MVAAVLYWVIGLPAMGQTPLRQFLQAEHVPAKMGRFRWNYAASAANAEAIKFGML